MNISDTPFAASVADRNTRTPIMDPGVKAMWTEMLRSGDYKQGSDALRNKDNEFCCLGVLCEAYRVVTGEGEWELDEGLNSYSFTLPSGEMEDAELPHAVAEWAGLVHRNPVVLVPQEDIVITTSLAEANDGMTSGDVPVLPPQSFEKIAKIITQSL